MDAGPPATSTAGWTLGRKHVAMALAALVAGAVFISRADGGPSAAASELRTTEFAGPELTDEDEEVTVVEFDERTLKARQRRDNAWRSATDPGETATDDTFEDDVIFDDSLPPDDELPPDDYEDYEDYEDYGGFSSYTTLPRRNSTSGRTTSPQPTRPTTRPTVATTSTTTTTVADTTTTAAADTTTTQTTTAPTTSTTTTTASTTTTTLPPPVWVAATSGLPHECGDGLRVWRRADSLLASIAGSGLFISLNSGTSWTPLPAAGAGSAEMRMLVQDPATATTFWIAGAEGIFQTKDNGFRFVELGTFNDVRSLSVGITASGADTLLAVVGTAPTLHRSVDDGATWIPVLGPAGGGVVGHPLVLDAQSALLGTSTGVHRTANGGATWTQTFVHPSGVVGAPVRAANGTITWLLGNGGGVIRSTDAGGAWTAVPSTGVISPTATSLVPLPDGRLVTLGVSGQLIASADGGVTWVDFGPACPPTRPG